LPFAPLPLLRTIILAGETCSAGLVSRWSPGRQLFNAYGPTETTVCATVAVCRADDAKPTIGFAIPTVRVYLLDVRLQPVLDGSTGEIYIGGPGVARGYLQRPDLTAERFVPDPFSQEAGQRLYRTGDSARTRDKGELDYLGRLDHQIKLRGFRIEPGEIETRLGQHAGVQEVVVE